MSEPHSLQTLNDCLKVNSSNLNSVLTISSDPLNSWFRHLKRCSLVLLRDEQAYTHSCWSQVERESVRVVYELVLRVKGGPADKVTEKVDARNKSRDECVKDYSDESLIPDCALSSLSDHAALCVNYVLTTVLSISSASTSQKTVQNQTLWISLSEMLTQTPYWQTSY